MTPRLSAPRRGNAAARAAATVVALAAIVTAGTAAPSAALAGALRTQLAAAATPGPRPVDPNATCVTSANDIAALPAAQVRLAPDGGWRLSTGADITVAVLDSGVDPTVPQLSGRVDAGVDVAVPGYTGDADCLGQGTAMAGLVAAAPAEGIGFHGMAPAARIFPVRVVADDLTSTPDVLAAGIQSAVAAGARIILVTVTATATSPALAAALTQAAAADVLVIAPAEVPTTGGSGYAAPAPYVSVLAVGAVDEDGAGTLQETGAVPIVDVAAPGVGVVSTLPEGGHTSAYTGARPAAAYVAGIAALVRSEFPTLTAAQVRNRLELTADHPGTQVPDPLVGWGVVNAEAALSEIIPAEVATTAVPTTTPSSVVVPPPHPVVAADSTAVERSVWIFVVAAVLALATLVALAVVPRGRRTGWRPMRAAGPPGGNGAGPPRR